MVGWKLKRGQRAMFVDTLPDAANLAVGALFFGQFLSAEPSTLLAVVGLALWCVFIAWAAVVAGEDE